MKLNTGSRFLMQKYRTLRDYQQNREGQILWGLHGHECSHWQASCYQGTQASQEKQNEKVNQDTQCCQESSQHNLT